MEIRIAKGVRFAVPQGDVDILQLKPPAVSEKRVRQLAIQLGMNAKSGALTNAPDRYIYKEGFLELTVFRASGGFRYLDRSRWQVDDGESNLRLTDKAVAKIASDLAEKMKLASTEEFRFAKAARLHVAAADLKAKNNYDRVIDVGVALQRQIGQLPVDGPGGRLVIYLAGKGVVTGIERIWRERAKIFRKGGSFRSLDDLISELSAHYQRKNGILEVQEIRTAYFEEGWRATQTHLQPAFIVIGMALQADEGLRKKVIYVAPALTNAVGRVTPRLTRTSPHTARKN